MTESSAQEPEAKRPGIREIALSLGISIGTVSRSMNNRYGVNARTRELVINEARRLGYVPNKAARSLKDHPSLSIGLYFSPFRGANGEINPAALSLINAVKKSLTAAGMALRVVLFSDLNELKRQTDGVDVAVFYGHFENDAIAIVHAAGIPAVLLQHEASPFEDQVSVTLDMACAGSTATEYLAALGHERIGIVLSPLTELHSSELLKGFKRSLEEFHLPFESEWVCEMPPELTNKEGGRTGMEKLLHGKTRPTAVIFASDWMALGGLRAAKDAGLRVPEDISIIGFDNLDISAETDPPLTTFDVHLEREVAVLTRLVEDLGQRRWNPDGETRQVLLAPDLIRRQSCACLRPPIPA